MRHLIGGVNLHDSFEQLDGIGLVSLKSVAADNRAKATTLTDCMGFFQDGRVIILLGPTGKDHDAPTVEGPLYNMTHTLSQCTAGYVMLFIDRFCVV